MMLAGKLYQRQSWERRIGEIGYGLWPTITLAPDAPNSGANRKIGPNSLTEAVRMGSPVWPTPRSGKTTDEDEETFSARQSAGKVATPPLALAVKIYATPSARDWKNGKASPETMMKNSRPLNEQIVGGIKTPQTWPTPSASSRDGTISGGHPGLAGGSGNRKKLYKMLGKEEGKKMGCQQLNPSWVEWLMGWPIGWTDLRELGMVKFQQWLGQHGKS
jgi:hypothetical protein